MHHRHLFNLPVLCQVSYCSPIVIRVVLFEIADDFFTQKSLFVTSLRFIATSFSGLFMTNEPLLVSEML